MKNICGIYKLNFCGTDKVYIGLSNDIHRRYRGHKSTLTKGAAPEKLQEAYNMYGMPSFEILFECEEEELDAYEKEIISIYNSVDNGFNSRDGGATGAGISVRGEGNGRAEYTKKQYIGVFKELVNTLTPYKDISIKFGVSIQLVDHIATGVSHAKWLQSEFPEEYSILISKIGNRQNTCTILVNIDTGEEVSILSVKDFCETHNIPRSSMSGVITGRYQSTSGWRLKVPVTYAPQPHITYTVKYEDIEYTISNISKFCREQNITNRKGFTKMLKGEIEEHKGWTLA